ncbi:hypothetical protein IE81DRAFT_319163 [Ceraceosorus guamensis]|uniref:RPEL repeat protein n=1 Tax=Ceraceosorus guamensis TaxID=1522189 RepID=A0A316W8S3_9BASI|nr:hypothetical protein IE81DRAFT_319163 [Ceraceosorus guamensis]PWN46279.1 hypothetical protein IE81DRAFT_319163 [Ceraceosorus guamensis]
MTSNPNHHAEEASKLEKLLQGRSDVKELQEKGILKNSTAAPALQAAQAELIKHQLEDRLEGKLERRPDRAELERLGILKDDAEDASVTQAKKEELEKQLKADGILK